MLIYLLNATLVQAGGKMRIRSILVLTVLLMTAGCQSQQLRGPTSLFPDPSAATPLASLKASNGEIACSPSGAIVQADGIPSEFTQFAILSYCSYIAGKDTFVANWQIDFIDKGISLANQTCDIYFGQMEAQRAGLSYAQTNMNITGSAVTAALAVSTNHSRAIFNTATFLTAGNAWFENYKANYILTPQLRKLHEKIQTQLRDPIAAQMKAKSEAHDYRSFDDAKRDVMQYDRLCSTAVLQDVVAESVAKAEIQGYPAVGKERTKKAEPVIESLYQIGGEGSAGTYTAGDVEQLFVVATIADPAERILAANALSEMSPKLKSHVKALGLNADVPVPTVTEKFQYLGELLQYDISSDVAAFRALLAEHLSDKTKSSNELSAVRMLLAPDQEKKTKIEAVRAHYQARFAARQQRVRQLEAAAAKAKAWAPNTVISFGYEIKGSK